MMSCLSIVGQARATPTGRLLKLTRQLAQHRVKSDVYHCLVSHWTQAVTNSVSSSVTADSYSVCYYIHLMAFLQGQLE